MSQQAQPQPHPDFATLAPSWILALESDNYSPRTRRSYHTALTRLAEWLAQQHPGAGPGDVTRNHIRGWLIHVRDTRSGSTARAWLPGVRHFYRWAIGEGELASDPTEGIRTPPGNDQETPLLTRDQIHAMLATCAGREFVNRRDAAIIYLFADGGLRLSELTGLRVDDVDVRERMVFVEGKGTNRSGKRRRAVPLGVKATLALDRYLRERRRHAYAETEPLWLGDRNRPLLSADGVKRMIERRGQRIGIKVHPHMFRHTWADAFRAAGGNEGDLMVLGGWRSRAMLDRYGKTNATGRAKDAYRRLSFGDRL